MIELPPVAIGAIVAAIIGGMIGLASLVGGKENKTSEFRQNWIDDLRADTAAFISHAIALDGVVGSSYPDRKDIWAALREDSVGLMQTEASIRMRLNPDEDGSKKILKLLDEITALLAFYPDDMCESLKAPPARAVVTKARGLTCATNEVLRRDWKRVKRGEGIYVALVAVAGVLLVLSLASLFFVKVSEPNPQKAVIATSLPSTTSTAKTTQVMPPAIDEAMVKPGRPTIDETKKLVSP